ncbi:Effector protein, partial [Chryseobacterium taichungense]
SLFLLEYGGGTGTDLVNHFEGKQHDLKIEATTNGNSYNDGVAYINTLLKPQSPTINGLQGVPLFIALAHEMAHGMDPIKKYLNDPWQKNKSEAKENWTSWGEIYATHIENKIRSEWGLSLRSSYTLVNSNESMGKLDLATILVDKKGNSTFYDQKGNKLNMVMGEDKINAYQSFLPNNKNPTFLTNRYNYYERTNKAFKPLYYVFFCLILCPNSFKAQYSQIGIFFEKEKLHAYRYCQNELKNNEDYLSVKKAKDTALIKLLEGECNLIASNYNSFEKKTIDLLNLNDSDKKRNFIIINKTIRANIKPQPVLTVLKFENSNKYYASHNYEDYYKIKQDSLMAGYKPEQEFEVFEKYFYHNHFNNKIFSSLKKAIKSDKNFGTYYIIARVSGKIITKKIYFADDFNH